MDARWWGQSQSRRSSLKRPWDEEDTLLPARSNAWNGTILPPIEPPPAPYRRPSMPLASELVAKAAAGYTHEPGELSAKRLKYEGNEAPFPPRTTFLDSSSFAHPHQGERDIGGAKAGDPQYAQNTSGLCPRCRRLTTQLTDLDQESTQEVGDSIQNPELALFTQLAETELTKALRTLASGISSARGGTICRESLSYHQDDLHKSPPIGQRGLTQSLDWLVGKLAVLNKLADKLVKHVQSPVRQEIGRNSPQNDTNTQDGSQYSMKRHLDGDPNDAYRLTGDGAEPSSDSKIFKRRRSVLANPNPEDLISIKAYNEYHSPHSSMDGPSRRSAIMNPPPPPIRQLPSSPGRSLPSPTSMNFPSPLAASYGSSSQSMTVPPPGSQASPGTHYLPPIGSAHYSDSAIHAHSASLQHEVSVQKIALSSLQGEHDKLLAAFSRSQTRASALETKHSVSDNEIVVLSEEKVRLQNQVTDLEKDIEDITRSRNEARQSAVQEGVQYVEIIKKASHLEKLAAEERQIWNKLKATMEQRINHLSGGMGTTDSGDFSPTIGIGQGDTPAPPIDGPPPPDVKFEPTDLNESRSTELASSPYLSSFHQSSVDDLKAEISKWRNRCEEVEDTLKAVREESRSMEGIVHALGLVGKSILERADRTLQ